MASLEPSFRRGPDGCLLLTDSVEARVVKNQHRERDYAAPRPAAVVRKEAEEMVKKAGGDVSNTKHLLGCFEIQFGCFRGMTFRWLLENSPGYAGYLVAGMENDERKPTDNRWVNKMAIKKYVELWDEGRIYIDMKKKQKTTSTVPMKVKVPGVSSTAELEMSDEQLLIATQEIEQKLYEGGQYTQGVPVMSSRDMFVPTVSMQRKALLSGDRQQVHEPLSVAASIQKPIQSATTVKEPSLARSQPSPAVTTSTPAKLISSVHTKTLPYNREPEMSATDCSSSDDHPSQCITQWSSKVYLLDHP